MTSRLIDRLPKVRGRYGENVDLSSTTWFRVGGTAEVVFKPEDTQDLCLFLREKPEGVPICVVGVSSNLIIRDGGIPGVVIKLGRGFRTIVNTGTTIDVGAGVLDRTVAEFSRDMKIGGLEFLAGIPGTVGGALRMNAGAYGTEIKDILLDAHAVDLKGKIHRLTAQDCGFSYRHSAVPEGWIFTQARFKGHEASVRQIQDRLNTILTEREEAQPVRARTGGSTFANPAGQKAWQLIDEAGCRGMTVGGAQVSEKHCNFLINTGQASAKDLEELGEQVRARVLEKTGVDLKWEVRRIGVEPEGLSLTASKDEVLRKRKVA